MFYAETQSAFSYLNKFYWHAYWSQRFTSSLVILLIVVNSGVLEVVMDIGH